MHEMAPEQRLGETESLAETESDGGSLATMRPRRRERSIALAVVALSALAFILAVPFARTPLPKIAAFIPAYESALIVIDFITAVLLFGQFRRRRSLALLLLASR